MNLTEIELMFPPIEWRQANATTPFPLHCKIGDGMTTIRTGHSSNSQTYTVSWSEDGKNLVIDHIPNEGLARYYAEFLGTRPVLQV